ncbi:heavy metal-responsive transcriptional regulator [Pelagicoccus enzymogenes]|uniref:heavy metal-responsive transcriptional regulator n=1 Tax=Pelagicoccus enzymogenes TaxID=2773457 RepID=UPI00280E0D52|nr:heavy metal-responsive transcriptional regulator [Pelagicoccus enzymogenes]MDQ8198226.1 heavy metal-responsive transcriptional regulator [Pelagicoccus enzymogenes]
MKIGELAKAVSVNPQTIRYYEREGVLPEPRRRYDSSYREYDEDALERLRFIKHAQSCGLKLADIKILLEWENLPDEACPDVRELLKERIGELDAKIREMRSFSKSLKRLLSACEESCDARCAVLEEFGKRST